MATQGRGSSYHATDGAAYEVFLGRWTRRLAQPMLDFAELPDAGALLDVGCGTGSLAKIMADRWPARRVVGVDIAAPYIAFARAQAAATNLAFEIADAAKLPFADRSFAGAAAQLVLNFVPDPLAALNEMRRVTVPGGHIVAAVWDFRGGLVYQRIFWDTAAGIDAGARPRATDCFPARSRCPMASSGCSSRPVSIGSSERRSRSAWTTRASTTTGSRSAAARGRSERIWRGSTATCAHASSRPLRPPIAPARRTGRAR